MTDRTRVMRATRASRRRSRYGSTRLGDEEVDESRFLIGLVAEEEITLGFLLAGIGECPYRIVSPKNYLGVKKDTPAAEIEHFFIDLYNRKHIGIILISREIMDRLALPELKKPLPVILEFPSRKALLDMILARETDAIKEHRFLKAHELNR
ncbi:V-type proton ATPase subunit F isoform X2 [Teleopsis dalmanni]|uniref:V-type proton ATPase subunit F isoform X2 n=1 Tax=Teleopsis dalmanni TaxID=139649 RepID=UPI0018CFB706|nr:V-type proton ATPase subunit F isoform X2 [Teleopsis dalmanni]